MSDYITCKEIGILLDNIDGFRTKVDALKAFLSFVRYKYLNRNLNKRMRSILKLANINVPENKIKEKIILEKFNKIIENENIDWGDWRFHLDYRINLNRKSGEEDFDLFFNLSPMDEIGKTVIKKITKEGVKVNGNGNEEINLYDLSILPLNLLLDSSVKNYFIPPIDYLEPHSTKKPDPYGIIHGKSRSQIDKGKPNAIKDTDTGLLLGSHKFSHTLLLNIDFYCPMGCSDCYKTRMGTREYLDPKYIKKGKKPKIYSHYDLGELNPPSKSQISLQAKQAVKWMNETSRGQLVYDVILSGGEPLCLSNESIKIVLDEFKRAENLRVFRICTGMLFLGAPFRISHELLDILCDFSEETGIRLTFQAHLGNHHMITPEAVIAIQKIKKHGIPIYSQIPIKHGINFFLDDLDKTINYLVELGRRQVVVGIEPYMFIIDMHPSTNAYYVPIEPLMQVWGMLIESHDYIGLERPRTLSVLFEDGNIILSGHSLFSAKKQVDKDNDRVIYTIPRIESSKGWKANIAESFIYSEPLLKGINDDSKSLNRIKEQFNIKF